MSLCSIVTPVFQDSAIFALFLESLWSTIECESEVILVNDGSGPAVDDIIERYRNRNAHILVKTTSAQHPRGGATALNKGLRMAAGDTVVIADSDLILLPGWQRALLNSLSDSTVGAAGALLLYPQTGGVQHCGIAFTEDIGRHLFLNSRRDDVPNTAFDAQAVVFALCAMRRHIVDAIGEVDEGYFNGYEDLDYMMRIQAGGWRVILQPQAVAYHWERSNGVNRASNRKRNLGRFWRQWGTSIRPDLPSHLVARLGLLSTDNEIFTGIDISRDRPDARLLWKAIGDGVPISRIEDFSHVTGQGEEIWLPQVLGNDGWVMGSRLLILVDNFVQLLGNHYWFEQRRRIREDDVVIDLYANALLLQRLRASSWPGTKIR